MKKDKNYQKIANLCIALSGISVSFMHALYSTDPESGYSLVSFSLLATGLPFLVVSWSSYNYLTKLIDEKKPSRFSVREIDKHSSFGISMTLLGVSIFFLSWHMSLFLLFITSSFFAIWKSPSFQRSFEIEVRSQRIKKIRSEKGS